MKRINIDYGGATYSLGNRDYDGLKAEIEQGLARGPIWLRVNAGEGTRRDADLLITPGVALTLIAVPDELPPDSPEAGAADEADRVAAQGDLADAAVDDGV